MACEYFVGDRYISENEFKALLNEGLLDTLLSNKKIDIKGFKIDSSKVLSQDTKIIKRLTVPANKLAKILAKEVSEREGYPANMLSALELNNTKTDFKIPLWASPYADKFESLLTSLVTNKIIKQKFPGGSYVLGSEEGFKIKEGDETAGDLKNSNIVFTSKFDATQGLQPMRYDKESGKILPAQIMIPFKFRNEQGEILNINDFIIKDETGRQMLDTSKIPEKLLQLFGFRIPTQERNSMAAVEIVGFLPEASGDLILAPRDFTKQMGSDFDVDKLYTYMYNHYYLNGKIYTNFKNSAKDIEKLIKIVKDQISELRDNMKISKEDKKLIDTYINEVIDSNEKGVTINSDISIRANQLISKAIAVKSFSEEAKTTLNNAITQLSILNRSYKAARQNKILDLHLEMMTSTNPEIIASIVALDSYGEFEQLAKDLAEIRKNKGLIQSPITILSDIYQRTKYLNAAAGKNCLGAFSLDSTFNAIAQGKDLVYNNLDNDNQNLLFGSVLNPKIPSAQQILDANEPIAIFGNSIAKGDLSNKYTLKSQSIIAKAKAEKRELTETEKESLKYKSNIIRALQSTAADNEKAQILDKLNINDNSLQVIKAMTLLGFEENDIVGLITQDIIWEYFEALNKIQSSLTKYEKDAKEKIREELINKYDPQKKLEGLSPDEYNLMALTANKSGTELLDMVANSKFNPTISTSYNLNQIFLLDKFLKLEEVGATIQQIQSTINSESNGIPKSLLETANKVTQIKNLNSSSIFNASALLGEYNPKLNSYEPNTISGFAAIYGTEFANTIYRPFFPYQKTGFETLFQEVLTHIPGSNKTQNMSKLTEAQKTVFKGVKSFLYSNSNTNLFTANPDQERNRLFIDVVDGNMSLASILKNLSNQVWFQKNAFLNKLDFNININGTPSRIEFEAATAENFDERNIYEGFLSLLNKNFPIGTFNNIEYTSRTLAQELVAAAFLEGGMQGSKQYMKYVPIAYLKTLGFGEYLNDVSFNFVDTFKGTLTESGVVYSQPSEFTRQYFQNNPELVKNITLESLKNKSLQAPKISFTLNKQALENNFVESIDPTTGEPTKVQTQFLSIREPKGKFALYEFDSINKIYRRIPVLKDKFGFVQYNSENSNIIPIERENQVVSNNKAEIPAPGYNIQNIPAEVHKEFNVDNVNNTQLPAPIATLPISKTLSGTSEALDDLINALVDSGELSIPNVFLLNTLQNLTRPANFKLIYSKDSNVKAKYDYDNNILTINLNHNNFIELNDIANTLAHELIHSATGHTIKQYESGLIKDLTSAQITAIENLKSLQNKYIKYLTSQGKDAQLAAFTEDYKAWKKGNKSINFNKEQIADFYGAMKLSEFVTMALTDKAFQERLKNVKDSENKSLWNQIIDAITELINTLGITIPKGSILAGAIKSSMDLINANQEALMQQEEVFYSDEESANMAPKTVKPENISSKGSDFAKKLTNVGNTVGLIYKGKQYVNSEHAYQTWKSGEFNQQGYDLKGGKVRGGKIGDTFSIMTDILTEKLKQHPELVQGINKRGGLAYIQQSTHNVIGDKFWESTGQNKFIEALTKAYNSVQSTQPSSQPTSQVKPGVNELFSSNPELASIGTPEQYSQYLDSVFPDSKVKDIVYHATKNKDKILEEGFDKQYLTSRTGISNKFWDPTGELEKRNRLGFFFAKNGQSIVLSLQGFGERFSGNELKNSVLSTILNLTNPQVIDDLDTSKVKEGYDGIISTEEFHIPDNAGGIDYTDTIYVAPEPEQIHILGSKQDIEGFKKFAQPSALSGAKLDFSKLQNPEQFRQMPTDDSLAESPINKELYEKYLLLCGK